MNVTIYNRASYLYVCLYVRKIKFWLQHDNGWIFEYHAFECRGYKCSDKIFPWV